MDDLGQRITEILQDPGRLQQIMEMASAMGLSKESIPQEGFALPDSAAVQQVSQLIQQTQTKEKRQQTLVQALLPYLSPGRQLRLERAMEISHLSRIAGAALRGNQQQNRGTEEDETHV